MVPLSTPGCEFQFGIYAEAPCSPNYYKCAFGVVHPEPCEAGLAYDERTHSCNWPDLMLEQGCNPERECRPVHRAFVDVTAFGRTLC